jgi:DNA adenine methylase
LEVINIFRYIGGKKFQAPWISGFIPKTKEYMEIFGGAFWVYIAGDINAERVIYNDYSKLMYNIFTCLKDFRSLYNVTKKMPEHNAGLFEKCKKAVLETGNNFDVPSIEMASNYIYLLTHVFSGRIIENNIKMVERKAGRNLTSFNNKLKSAKMQRKLGKIETSNLSYELALKKYDSKDMTFYLDPPYAGTEDYYSFHEFGLEDHQKLADVLKSCEAKWLLSYYDFPELTKMYPEDQFHYEKKMYTKKAAVMKGQKKNIGEEILIMNYIPKNEAFDLFFK